jgi:hypothetical protein
MDLSVVSTEVDHLVDDKLSSSTFKGTVSRDGGWVLAMDF